MTATIVGAQLGDEGKGGIVDLLGETADVVVRYQGGDNAGHTVVTGDEEYKLSLVPSGSVRGRVGVLGNGCVINPRTLFEEIDALAERGLEADVRLAERAHVICPSHRQLDGIEEAAKDEADTKVGTTGRGIGPTYGTRLDGGGSVSPTCSIATDSATASSTCSATTGGWHATCTTSSRARPSTWIPSTRSTEPTVDGSPRRT
jgi:adenylosuccinate synthase